MGDLPDGSDTDAGEFARMAVEMASQPDVDQTLDSIVQHALAATAAEGVGILMIVPRSGPESVASSGSLARRADELQMRCQEGPCLQAIWSHDTFVVTDTASDDRWPTWEKGVHELGWQSVLGVRLFAGDKTLGALNLFAHDQDAFGGDDVEVAEIFGRHASIALNSAQVDDGLRIAISAKHLIGQAQGILMERYAIDADRAFAVLRRHSQDHNVRLRTVAERVIATRKLPNS